MGYLLDTMTPDRVDGQRDVVKNERRQSYENTPYGMASIEIDEMLYPEGHPYRWPTIGYMEDLTAASYDDVVGVLQAVLPAGATPAWWSPATSIRAERGPLVEKWFGDVKPGQAAVPPIDYPRAADRGEEEDDHDRVQLPRLYLAWLTPRRLRAGRRRARRGVADPRRRQELAAVQAAGLRHADRAGRQRLPASARSGRSSRSSSPRGRAAGHDRVA